MSSHDLVPISRFIIHPYLVRLTVPGGLYKPAAATDLYPAEFLLAGEAQWLDNGPAMAAEFSLTGAEMRPTSGPAWRPLGEEGAG